jgi:hypothetical protein
MPNGKDYVSKGLDGVQLHLIPIVLDLFAPTTGLQSWLACGTTTKGSHATREQNVCSVESETRALCLQRKPAESRVTDRIDPSGFQRVLRE